MEKINGPSIKTYLPIWSKYRPVILKLMIDAATEPQQYQLSGHEFKAMNARQKGGYNFVLQVLKGKAINNIRDCQAAKELLEILQISRKASELTEEAPYEITLDKQFVLHITKMNQPELNEKL
jgi:hypothetical protein